MRKKLASLSLALGVLVSGGTSSFAWEDGHVTGWGNSAHHSGTTLTPSTHYDGEPVEPKLVWGSSAGTTHFEGEYYYGYPNGDGAVGIKFWNSTADGNDTAGEIMFYLEEYIPSTYSWKTIAHFGTYKNTGGWVQRALNAGYGGSDIDMNAIYRWRFSSPNNSETVTTSFAHNTGFDWRP